MESPNRSPETEPSIFKRINDGLYQIERLIVVISLLVMSVVVFASVVYRRYADPTSMLAAKLAKVIGVEPETAAWESLQEAAGPITALLMAGIIYLGFRTASRRPLLNRGDEAGKTHAEIHGEPLSHAKCAAYTLATIVVSYGLMVLLFGTGNIEQYECIELDLVGKYSLDCGYFPAGVDWAQPLGLILTLWVAFIGASMATRDNLHLKVEAVQQAMPESIRRYSGLLAGILTAIFCLLLAYLGYRYVVVKHEEYEISNHLGGLHDGINIPYFVSFAIVPIAYALMAMRFVGIGILAFRGELEETPAELRELDKHTAEPNAEPNADDPTREPPPENDPLSAETVREPSGPPPDDPDPDSPAGDTADESVDSDDGDEEEGSR